MEAFKGYSFDYKSIREPLSVDLMGKSHVYSEMNGQNTPPSSPKSKGMCLISNLT